MRQASLIGDQLVLHVSAVGGHPRGARVTKQADALASLADGNITARAEAVRELGRVGDEQVLDTLLATALDDKSPGVRLAAASAAADVLARYRIAPHVAGLEPERRADIIQRLRAVDPGRNTGLFQVLACAGDPAVVLNLGRGVRDPRVDVRTGALVGLERLLSSGSVNGDPRMARALGELLCQRRLRSDASLELARLAWRAGLWELRPQVEQLSSRLEERWLPLLAELLDGFPVGLTSEHVLGCWQGRGLDCGEQRAKAGPATLLIVLPSTLLVGAGPVLDSAAWTLDGGSFSCAALADGGPQPVRVLRSWFDGQETTEVLQLGTASFGRVQEKELPALVDTLASQKFGLGPQARQLLALLEPQLSEGSAGAYARAVLQLLSGDHPAARESLEALASAKRPRPELRWHLARLLQLQGDKAGSLAHAQAYLEAAPRKSPFIAAARRRTKRG